jgi:hypothetical protein
MSNWKATYLIATCWSSILALTLKKSMEEKAERDIPLYDENRKNDGL